MEHSKEHDLIVIGAGITGVGVFLEAARRGLKVLLLERGRPGGATTAVTSGLFHGGLRYLPYDIPTSRSMSREAGLLSRKYARLVHRDVFLWPVYAHHRLGMEIVEGLMEYYDELTEERNGRAHVRLSAAETIELEPGLEPEGLAGALSFDEWRVDVAGLVRALLDEARSAGGELLEKHRVSGFRVENGLIAAVETRDASGKVAEHPARLFINAGGPWAEEIARMAGSSRVRLSLRKGVHLVLEGESPRRGLIFPGIDGRYLGLYPRPGGAWVGPTDDPFGGSPDDACASEDEGDRIERGLRKALPGLKARRSSLAAGLRPLFRQRGLPGLFSRDFRLLDHAAEGIANLVTVMGGKLTTFRPMAQTTLNLAGRKLGIPLKTPPGGSDPQPFPRYPLGLTLPISAGIMGLKMIRHGLRRLSGRRREGLSLFRETYSK